MYEDIKAQWTADLRSNRYQQGYIGWLREESGENVLWCPLGLLAQRAVWAGVTEWEPPFQLGSGNLAYWLKLGPSGEDMVDVYEWAGLTSDDADAVVYRNDTLRLSFAELADFIDEYL